MTSLGHAVAAVWACGTLLAGAAAAQRDDAVAAFADVIDARVVNVEVVVTDEQGRRVHGLTAADFELLVDGRPVPLDYFSEIREGRAVASPAGDVPTVPALRPNHDVRSTALDAASEAGHDGPLDQLHAARLGASTGALRARCHGYDPRFRGPPRPQGDAAARQRMAEVGRESHGLHPLPGRRTRFQPREPRRRLGGVRREGRTVCPGRSAGQSRH